MTTNTPTADALNNELQALQAQHIELVNESLNHAGYFDGKESHFKVAIVSPIFQGLRLVQRHQKVYAVATDLMNPGKIRVPELSSFRLRPRIVRSVQLLSGSTEGIYQSR